MIFILIVILFIDETKETVIRPQKQKQTKKQAYRLLKNTTEIKKSSVHNLNPL